MKKQEYPIKRGLLCAVVLLAVAAASFLAVNNDGKRLFDGYLPFQVSFAVLALSMLLCAACQKTWITLVLCAAAAVGLWFYTPAYAALVFPVVLQAALYDSCGGKNGGERLTYLLAAVCEPVTICLWFYCKRYDDFQLSAYTEEGGRNEKYLCFVLLFALILLYVFLARRAFLGKGAPAAKAKRTTAAEQKKNRSAAKRRALAFLLCAVNTVFAVVYAALFIKMEYCQLLLCSQALFMLFLEFRGEPLLRLHVRINALLDAALRGNGTADDMGSGTADLL